MNIINRAVHRPTWESQVIPAPEVKPLKVLSRIDREQRPKEIVNAGQGRSPHSVPPVTSVSLASKIVNHSGGVEGQIRNAFLDFDILERVEFSLNSVARVKWGFKCEMKGLFRTPIILGQTIPCLSVNHSSLLSFDRGLCPQVLRNADQIGWLFTSRVCREKAQLPAAVLGAGEQLPETSLQN